jgi:nucleoside 2-deoxyribosyltransferase
VIAPKVVCICGSTRFRGQMIEVNRWMTMAGLIVLAPGVFQHDGDPLTEAEKEKLDKLHLEKIDMADQVYVVNPGNYIGESTAREMEYAYSKGKPVMKMVCEDDDGECRCYWLGQDKGA